MTEPLPEGEKLDELKAMLRSGEACLDKGDYESALGYFDAFCEQEVRVSYVWKSRGECLIGVGKYKEAVTSLKEAIRLDPRSAEAWGYFAFAAMMLGEKKFAIDILEKAESQVRRKEVITFFRGKLNERIGNDTDALFDYVRLQLLATKEEDKITGAKSVYRILNKDK